jgi:5'-3' exonuclease
MGVPQLFGWLFRKYKNIVSVSLDKKIDILYFDFNGLIYHCYADLMREKYDILKDSPLKRRQEVLIEEILKYTKSIICTTVNPKIAYLSIDGVVPMAKMHQQRLRRYKSPYLKEWENDIKKRYGIYKDELLDTNQITPGTDFMRLLNESLQGAIDTKYFGDIQMFLSDSEKIGEGEHKIVADIREKSLKDKNICIYGLDADLILLSLTIPNNSLFLLRENVHIDASFANPLLYVSIPILAESVYHEIMKEMSVKSLDKQRIIRDYVFLSFLLGNDFLHCLPSLSIVNNGIDFVIKLYSNSYAKCKNYLLSTVSNTVRINNGFLKSMFEYLSRSEDSNLKFLAQRKKVPNPPNFDDHYSEDKWKWDRIPHNPRFEKCFSVIDYKNSNWKKQYYNIFFDFDCTKPQNNVCMDAICKNYFDGILFTAKYYFDGHISWYWYNPYPVAPFVSDLFEYLQRMETKDINMLQIPTGAPFLSIEQLMMVLPKKSGSLLPKKLADEMDGRLAVFYPDEFEWIAEEKMMLYSIEPKLPLLDIDRIREVIREIFV